MKKHKPLNLLNNKGFWPEKVAIVDAIQEVLTTGQCKAPLPVRDYGLYRDQQWRDENDNLIAYKSVDWYVSDAFDDARMQVDSNRILESFAAEPWRNEELLGDHYDLFIMQEDMFTGPRNGESPTEYAVGRAQRLTAAVISTHRIEYIWGLPYSYLKTEVMRQLCFMFGVPDIRRDDLVIEGDEHFCRNICILRPAHVAPDDWDRLTEERLKHGALCQRCATDLRRFFAQAAKETG